jgi:hypothetical protein
MGAAPRKSKQGEVSGGRLTGYLSGYEPFLHGEGGEGRDVVQV